MVPYDDLGTLVSTISNAGSSADREKQEIAADIRNDNLVIFISEGKRIINLRDSSTKLQKDLS